MRARRGSDSLCRLPRQDFEIEVEEQSAVAGQVAAQVAGSSQYGGADLCNNVGSAAVNATEQTVANESTAPSGVAFTQPATKGAAIALGSIPAGQHRAVWVRRVVAPASAASNDTYTLRVECDTAA